MSVIKDALIASAVGEAMGVPVKSIKRSILLNNPVTSMISNDLEEGVWSYNTSISLATMDSIIKCNKLDYDDMAKRYCFFMNNHEYCAIQELFDIDETIKKSLNRFLEEKIDAVKCGGKGFNDNSNGSLNRMLPIALYCHFNKLKEDEVFDVVRDASSITHASDVCILGCFIFVNYLLFLLNGKDKYASYSMVKCIDYSLYFDSDIIEYYNRLLKTNINNLRVEDLKSSDYIVYSLEAILWITLNCTSYAESVVGAINLGDATDSIGYACGSIAGILYGYEAIPNKWLDKLKRLDYLEDIAFHFEGALHLR